MQSSKATRLQRAFVDSVYRLGGRSHGFRAWNRCKASGLVEGETLHMVFNTGWYEGEVIRYDDQERVSLNRFSLNNTLFHICDNLHNLHDFILHQPQPRPPAN